MITKIYGRNFKGQNFDQGLGQYTLLVGRNGAGKSARTQALAIAILGYSPQTGDKQPGAIFHTFASANEMWVGIELKADRLGRRFMQDHTGSVSQDFTHNGRRVPAKSIEKLLMELGSPRIFDLRAWMELSEQKRIEYLLSLSPPSQELSKIERELSGLSEKENKVRADARAAKMVVEQLTAERAKIERPAGTLPEVRAEIARLEAEIRQGEEEIQAAEIARREKEAREAAEAQAQRKVEEAREQGRAEGRAEAPPQRIPFEGPAGPPVDKIRFGSPPPTFTEPTVLVTSLNRIRKTLLDAGCQACAALLVVNAELRQHRKEEPHGNAA